MYLGVKKISLIALLLISQLTLAQLKTYGFEQIDSLGIKKPIVVFLHTDWCRACRVMEKETFANTAVIKELNDNFYFVSFDAESKLAIQYQNKIFKYKRLNKKSGIHELAEEFGKYKHQIKYPTTVILNAEHKIVFQHPSKLKAKGFLRLLKELKENEKI